MRYLRNNTATRVTVGPFLDQSDGITPEVALTVTAEHLTLVVDTGGVPTVVLDTAPTASGGANDMAHITGDDAGLYDLELAADDVDYLGRAMLSINNVAAHCPVWHEFVILPQDVYDAMVLGTDLFDVNVAQWLGTAVATPAIAGVPKVERPQVTLAGTASAGSATSITLTGGVATTGYYNGQLCIIVSGTGAGQARQILSYASDTIATVTRDWAVAPSSDSVFVVVGADVPGVLEAGTALSGGASTIELEHTASGISATYKSNYIMLTGGTGVGQTRFISAYNGGSYIATVTPAWTTQPAAGTVYQIIPGGRADIAQWLGKDVADPTVDGVPEVDITHALGTAWDSGGITAGAIVAAAANKIADHIIRRTFQNACDSANGDAKTGRSLLGAIAKLVNKIASSGGTLTAYEDDDTTALFTQTVTTSAAADPITELDTD